jgi:hypothetical protein
LGSEAQLQMLEAAATIDLIESKVLSLLGELAVLFLPEPQSGFRGLRCSGTVMEIFP